MLVFDVGANIGDKAARMRARGARVICFEPQPHCAETLRQRFSGDAGVVVVEQAMGAIETRAALAICDQADVLSTMSEAWKTGRFKDQSWTRSVEVQVGTLASAIARYGTPNYCKIDVEGFELEVLSGLDRPLDLLSFEFTQEFMPRALECLARLRALGFTCFNVSFGESGRFALETWGDSAAVAAALDDLPDPLAWGDIYAARDVPDATLRSLVEADSDVASERDTQAAT